MSSKIPKDIKAAIFPPSERPAKSNKNNLSSVRANKDKEIIRMFLDSHFIPKKINANAKTPHKIAKPVLWVLLRIKSAVFSDENWDITTA